QAPEVFISAQPGTNATVTLVDGCEATVLFSRNLASSKLRHTSFLRLLSRDTDGAGVETPVTLRATNVRSAVEVMLGATANLRIGVGVPTTRPLTITKEGTL